MSRLAIIASARSRSARDRAGSSSGAADRACASCRAPRRRGRAAATRWISNTSSGRATTVPPCSSMRRPSTNGLRQLAQIGERALSDLAALAITLAQQHGGAERPFGTTSMNMADRITPIRAEASPFVWTHLDSPIMAPSLALPKELHLTECKLRTRCPRTAARPQFSNTDARNGERELVALPQQRRSGELCAKLGDGTVSGGALFWRVGHLNGVRKVTPATTFGNCFSLQPAPGLGWRHDELEHHQPRRVLRERASRAHRPVPHGGEHALDGVRRSQMVPLLGGEVVEGQQRVAGLHQAGDRPLVFRADFSANSAIAASAQLRSGAVQIWCKSRFAAGCTEVGSLSSTLAVLCTVQR